MQLITTWFGTFLIDSGAVREKKLFPIDAIEIAKRLDAMDGGAILQEELELLEHCGYSAEVTQKRLVQHGKLSQENPSVHSLLNPKDYGYDLGLLREALLIRAENASKSPPGEDFHIIQALRAMDSLTEGINLVSERVRDWYSIHFPELARMVPEERLIALVSGEGNRDEIAQQVSFQGESIGAPLGKTDAESVQALARSAKSMLETRERLEKHVTQRMKEIAPSLSYIAGPLIGARLISLVGGLGKLAQKPSSTIQLLGAESALFRHLKSGVSPPKHGIIFQHPFVHGVPRHLRGRAARSFAGAISIAARVDHNGGAFIGEELQRRLDKRMASIRSGKKAYGTRHVAHPTDASIGKSHQASNTQSQSEKVRRCGSGRNRRA